MPTSPLIPRSISVSFSSVAIAAYANARPLAHQLVEWMKRLELSLIQAGYALRDIEKVLSAEQMSVRLHVSIYVYRKLMGGDYEPGSQQHKTTSLDVCRKLYLFFSQAFPEEATEDGILELGGHPTYSQLIAFAREHPHIFDDGKRIIALLMVTASPEWRSSEARYQADMILYAKRTREQDKILAICEWIEHWQEAQAG